MTLQEPDSILLKVITANLAYWQGQCLNLTDDEIRVIKHDIPNIICVIKMGLVSKETQNAAAELAHSAFLLIQRTGYWYDWLVLLSYLLGTEPGRMPRFRIKFLNHQGILLRHIWQLDNSIVVHRQALELAVLHHNRQATAELHFQLSEDYRLAKNYQAAEKEALAALDVFNKLDGVEKWTAAVWHTLGLIASAQNRQSEALERLEKAVNQWQLLSEPTELARALNSLGLALQEEREFGQALLCFQQALVELEPTASELDKSRVYNNLGRLNFAFANFVKAEEAFRKADSLALRQSGDYFTRAALLQNLGNSILAQRDERTAEAERALQQAVVMWRQLDQPLLLANSVGTLAETQALMSNKEDATNNFLIAINILEDLPSGSLRDELLAEFTNALEDLKNKPTA